eukprot:Plantae.Rhodophyta-Purpureofilum_apyrenoidigerum.ctg9531.p1 GENE.Plantae.Rhodophyta-Purpureofilum_apyrenoidigerum.ctg9531~~Plantae.Rhodophyta-Purpureofilum_apyrenoidigerum.ctg9531.p1  ORF type:complete len:214 (-),score=36.55 Plantae.Rhodophyta-Purpureofilum_apyrenoidigerum.ctg9531:123-764(-)
MATGMKNVVACALVAVLVTSVAASTTPKVLTALEKRMMIDESDFVIDIAASTPSMGVGLKSRSATVAQLPVLRGLGLSYVLLEYEPCGTNLPHVHPRGTEFLYMISGEELEVSIIEENGGRSITQVLTPGKAVVFPQGLLHHQLNIGCKPVRALAALSSEDAGTLSFPSRLFSMPDDALQTAFGIDIKTLRFLRRRSELATPRAACLKQCGLE